MNDMTPAPKGHNNPPDPIEEVVAEFDAVISEAQNWTDGENVTDKAGMKAVDAVLKEFKSYKTALAKAAKERTDPLHKVWKAEVAAVKVYTDDADRINPRWWRPLPHSKPSWPRMRRKPTARRGGN